MYLLFSYLRKFYLGRKPRITRLIDNTEIFLVPTMNPDGYAKSAAGCGTRLFSFGESGRNNANGVDLNRDFPRQFDERQDVDQNSLERGRQPETMYVLLILLFFLQ